MREIWNKIFTTERKVGIAGALVGAAIAAAWLYVVYLTGQPI